MFWRLLFLFALLHESWEVVVQSRLRRTEPAFFKYARAGKISEFKRLPRSKYSGGETPLDLYNYYYNANFSLGTPPQSFNLQVDTGSSNLWVTDKSQCTSDACQGYPNGVNHNNPYYRQRQQFDKTQSSSFVNTGNEIDIQYGAGQIQGKSAIDVFQVI
uniref:Peptidase A1 domain-containing protein n=1 Tax=Acrobeloides nanus TaxID=290746 RepID=A0A914DJQ7_9BILA